MQRENWSLVKASGKRVGERRQIKRAGGKKELGKGDMGIRENNAKKTGKSKTETGEREQDFGGRRKEGNWILIFHHLDTKID